eukprot:g59967.t1
MNFTFLVLLLASTAFCRKDVHIENLSGFFDPFIGVGAKITAPAQCRWPHLLLLPFAQFAMRQQGARSRSLSLALFLLSLFTLTCPVLASPWDRPDSRLQSPPQQAIFPPSNTLENSPRNLAILPPPNARNLPREDQVFGTVEANHTELDFRLPRQRIPHSSLQHGKVAFRCLQFQTAAFLQKPRQVVGFRALLDFAAPVHHATLFLCPSPPFRDRAHAESGHACAVLPWSVCRGYAAVYDKGADTYKYPPEAGMWLRPDGPFPFLLLQVHYLFPQDLLTLPEEQWPIDGSGIQLQVAATERAHSRMLALIDTSLDIPRASNKSSSYEFSYSISPEQLLSLIRHDYDKYGEKGPGLELLAAHLHAHHTCTGIRAEFGGQLLVQIWPYHGYGRDQTFLPLAKGTMLSPRAPLTVTCRFRPDPDRNTPFGVGPGQEMCGLILIYSPSEPQPPLPLDPFLCVANEARSDDQAAVQQEQEQYHLHKQHLSNLSPYDVRKAVLMKQK